MCAALRNSGFWFHFSSPQCQCQHCCGSQMLARADDDLLHTTSIASIQTEGMTGPLKFWMHYSCATSALCARLTHGVLLNLFQFGIWLEKKKCFTLELFETQFRPANNRLCTSGVFSTHSLTKSESNSCCRIPTLLSSAVNCQTWEMD